MHLRFDQAQQALDNALEHLKREFSTIRAGRANPHMLDTIQVDVYGQMMPINQVANVTVVDASLITIKPWDKQNLEHIKKAIEKSDLGISPSLDSDLIRLPIPALTEERRVEYVKLMKAKSEEARIEVRQIRHDVIEGLDKDKESSRLTEDEYDAKLKQLQVYVEETNQKVENLSKDKEKELMTV